MPSARFKRPDVAHADVGVVVPVLNEGARVEASLRRLRAEPDLGAIWVVDGGSDDDTVARAQRVEGVQVVTSGRGRGRQMNAGAARATEAILLFVHADVRLPDRVVARVRRALGDPKAVAGAFCTRTVCDDPSASRRWLAPLLPRADLRARKRRCPYGDQGIFVWGDAFRWVGGFPEVPILEDVGLGERIWSLGEVVRAEGEVEVSGRRFLAQPIRSTLVMNTFPLLYRWGVSTEKLARFYAQIR